MRPSHAIKALHHIALISPRPERTSRFYVDVLGLRHITAEKRLESPGEPILLGDDAGTLVTITPRADGQPGQIGIGAVHHVSLTVDSYDGLVKWKRWLQHRQIPVLGPYDQQAYQDIVFTDPDGVLLEIATRGPGWEATQDGHDIFSPPKDTMAPYRDEEAIQARTWREPITRIEPDMVLCGLHHVSTIVSSLEATDAFHREILDIPLVRKTIDHQDSEVEYWYWGLDGGQPGILITAFTIVHPHEGGKPVYSQAGPGVVDHFALGVGSHNVTAAWHARLSERGVAVARGVNEEGAASISFRGPDGQLLELAMPQARRTLHSSGDQRLGEGLAPSGRRPVEGH